MMTTRMRRGRPATVPILRRAVSLALLAGSAAPVMAQQATTSDATGPGVNWALSQRFWVAGMDALILDVAPTVDASGTVLLQTRANPVVASDLVSITSLAARLGSWSLGVSVSPPSHFPAGSTTSGGQINRREFDVNLGWRPAQGWGALALIYKQGRTDYALSDTQGRQKIRVLLAGGSVVAPIQAAWSMYGNLALGLGRSAIEQQGGEQDSHLRYTIGEFGLSRAIAPDFSVVLGWRVQTIEWRGVEVADFSADGLYTVVATRRMNLRSTTQGPMLALNATF